MDKILIVSFILNIKNALKSIFNHPFPELRVKLCVLSANYGPFVYFYLKDSSNEDFY